MKLVRFENGTYGIRKFDWPFLRYLYLDVDDANFWWGGAFVSRYAQGTEEQALNALARFKKSKKKLSSKVIRRV